MAFLIFYEPGIAINGYLTDGVITASDLMGNLDGEEISDPVDEIKAKNTYVNVHALAVPTGEVRGQIR